MADFGGFTIQTPQEVLARIQAQRDQFRQSQDPAVRRTATLDTALDTLFGNPQVEAAQRTTDIVNKAQRDITPNPGESDIDSELRRLKAVRDAVQDIDPSVASQVNQQMLKLGVEKLERQKLQAELTYKANEDARQQSEYAMKVEEHPLEIQRKQQEIDAAAAETQNYINPRTGEMVNVSALDSIQIKHLQQAGWVKAGINIQADDPAKLAGPTKATQTDLQKSLISAQNQLDAYGQTITKFDPSYLQLPTQAWNWAKGAYEKAGGTLSPEQTVGLRKFTEFRRNAVDGLNRYINEITGAAIGVKEEVRIRQAFPDAYKDGPTQFMAKLRETVKSTMGVQKRAQQMLAAGITDTNREQWDSIATPPVSDQEVDTFMMQYFGVPPQQQAPQSGTQPAGRPRIISKRAK